MIKTFETYNNKYPVDVVWVYKSVYFTWYDTEFRLNIPSDTDTILPLETYDTDWNTKPIALSSTCSKITIDFHEKERENEADTVLTGKNITNIEEVKNMIDKYWIKKEAEKFNI